MLRESDLEISILIVGYESASFLPACLEAVQAATAKIKTEVLFINNSNDASEKLIAAQFPWAQVCKSKGNIGFARATNLLASQATARNLLLLNPDTRIAADAVASLLDAANRNVEFGIFGGTTVIDEQSGRQLDRLELPNTRTLMKNAFRRRRSVERSIMDDDPLCAVSATSGGFMLVRRDVWRRLGGLDERFFLYAEDLDLCKRAIDAGISIARVSTALVFHSIGSGNQHTSERQLAIARGNATYHLKHFSIVRAILHIGLMWLGFMTRTLRATILLQLTGNQSAAARAIAPLVLRPWRWVIGYKHQDRNKPNR